MARSFTASWEIQSLMHNTDPEHVFTVASGCCSEFIVETEKLNGVARSGDISNAHPEWKSAVSKIMVYNKFVE